MCGQCCAASVSGGIPFGESSVGGCRKRVLTFGQSRAAFASVVFKFGKTIRWLLLVEGSCVVKTVPKVVDGWFPFCLKLFGDC